MKEAREAALRVLLHNSHGPIQGLPRTAGWGYPEPYTRDWMIAALGILASGDEQLISVLGNLLAVLAHGQTRHGHIPSLGNDPTDCGASDTTPLFLLALALYRKVSGKKDYLEEAAQKGLLWMRYQSPDDSGLIAQQPTSDWRDEQWVFGYSLFVNVLQYACLRLYGELEHASKLKALINQEGLRSEHNGMRIHEGLALPDAPYYALWVYKIHMSKRFDLLGNSLAILFGLADAVKAEKMIDWVEAACEQLRAQGELASDLPPCLIPYIQPENEDWIPRYEQYGLPGKYHHGGIWPFIAGFYVAALVAAGRQALAEKKLNALTTLVKPAQSGALNFGFNEWLCAQDNQPCGQDWQTWSAAMYLYAQQCVEKQKALFFWE